MRIRLSEEVTCRILAKRGLASTNHDFRVLGTTVQDIQPLDFSMD